jgi:protease-4
MQRSPRFQGPTSMSDTQEPHNPQNQNPQPLPAEEPPPYVIPVRYATAPPRPAVGPAAPPRPSGALRALLVIALAISLGVNLLLLAANKLFDFGDLSGSSGATVQEQLYSGKATTSDKIAVIKLDGVIMEGSNGFFIKQIDQAAADKHVKAVVLRINSPGGTITASDDLFRRLTELKKGENLHQKGGAKPIVVSMGSVAASGGYYIAMPADFIIAERTTITGSIGVYAAFPNVADLADKSGFGMNVIKAGDIKDSGSMFKAMTAQERQVWQDMVDHAYKQFTEVVEQGRPSLKGKLREAVDEKEIPDLDEKGKPKKDKTVNYVRRRADGGIYTADEAKKYGLIDDIGYLQAAIDKAKEIAKLTDPKVVTYEHPPTMLSALLGAQTPQPQQQLDPSKLASGAIPRLWYLAPQSELAGIIAAMGKEQ